MQVTFVTYDLFVSLKFESIFVTCKVPFVLIFCLREINQSGVILAELLFLHQENTVM